MGIGDLDAKDDEKENINLLLQSLEKSDAIFFKNSIPYSSHEARELLETDLVRSGITVVSADDFIKRIATRSLDTGHIYYLKLESGEKLKLSVWMSKELEKIREKPKKKKRRKAKHKVRKASSRKSSKARQ